MNNQRAAEVSAENLTLLQSKYEDYGAQNILLTGEYGLAVRLQDKVSRLLNLTRNNQEPNNESLADTFRDVANYGLIGQLLLENQFGPHAEEPKWVGEGEDPMAAPSDLPNHDYAEYDQCDEATGEYIGEEFPHSFTVSFPIDNQIVWHSALPGPDEFEKPKKPKDGLIVYLAGPIDNVSEETARSWREAATDVLSSFGHTTLNPLGAVGGGLNNKPQVAAFCRSMIDRSDAVLVWLPDKGHAFGTIREIEYARSVGTPVVVVSSWANRSVFGYDLEHYDNLAEALKYLHEAWEDNRV